MDHRGLPLNDFYGYIKINSSELDVTIPDGVLRVLLQSKNIANH